MNQRHPQQGFSLAEFMIASMLGLFILAGVIGILISNKATFLVQDGLSRLQENARYAKYIMTKEIRMAGFQGCNVSDKIALNMLVSDPPAELIFDQDKAVGGYEASGSGWSPALPTSLSGKVASGTDVVIVRKASSGEVNISSSMTKKNTPILVEDRLGLQANDYIIATDCEAGDIFQAGANGNATAITHTVANNITNDLSKAYERDAQVMKFEYFAFYIKDTGRTNNNGFAIFSLYRADIKGNETELVEGVENMQISYGIDTTDDGTADTYLPANTIESNNDWAKVKSIEFLSLFNTIEEVSPTEQSYTFNGNTVSSPGDRILRKEWGFYVTLRNRALGS